MSALDMSIVEDAEREWFGGLVERTPSLGSVLPRGLFGWPVGVLRAHERSVMLTAVQSLRLLVRRGRVWREGLLPRGRLGRPFRALGMGVGWTQGVALGCVRVRRWRVLVGRGRRLRGGVGWGDGVGG